MSFFLQERDEYRQEADQLLAADAMRNAEVWLAVWMINASGGGQFSTVLLMREVCEVNSKSYPYENHFPYYWWMMWMLICGV